MANTLKFIKTFISGQEYKHPAENSYFTKLYHSRDLSGRARLVFGLDEKSLITDRSQYGALYSGGDYTALKSSGVTLRSMKIMRNRVKKYEPGDAQSSLFDHTESDDPHVEDKKTINFEVANLFSTKAASKINELPQTIINSSGKRYFTATDDDIALEERGYYQYGVELEYVDNTLDYFKEKISDLDLLMKEFRLYHEESKRIGMTQYYQKVSDPHIDSPLEVEQIPAGDLKPAFNTVSNRFNKWFIDDIKNRYDFGSRPNFKAIYAFFELVMDLGGFPQGSDFHHVISTMFYMSNPEQGSPGGISKVIATIETTVQQIRTLLGLSYANLPGNDTSALGVNKSSISKKTTSKKRIIKITKWFRAAEEIFDATDNVGVGYDFLTLATKRNSVERNIVGPMIIQSDTYVKRVNQETFKYFKEHNDSISYPGKPNISDNLEYSKYSYLSPSWIRLGGTGGEYTYKNSYVMNSIAPEASEQFYNNIGSMILMKNATDKDVGEILNLVQGSTNGSVTPAGAALAHVFADRGCTVVMSETSPEFTMTEFTDVGLSKEAASADQLISNARNFEIQKGDEGMNAESEKVFQSMAIPAFGGYTPTLSPFNLGNLNSVKNNDLTKNTINAEALKSATPEDLEQPDEAEIVGGYPAGAKNLPNHLKSVIGNAASKRIAQFASIGLMGKYNSPQALPKFYMNYENLMKVEYLSMFEDGQVLNPIWVPLRANNFSDASPRKMFLCRLKRYENKQYNINENTAMKLPIYHEYFIIQHGTPDPPQQEPRGIAADNTQQNPIAAENSEYTNSNPQMYVESEAPPNESAPQAATTAPPEDENQATGASGDQSSAGGGY